MEPTPVFTPWPSPLPPEVFTSGAVTPPGMHPIVYIITYGFLYFALIVLGLNLLLFLIYQIQNILRKPPINIRKHTLVSIAAILIYFVGILALNALF